MTRKTRLQEQMQRTLEEWLLAQGAGFDVKISDPNSRVLQIQGPTSMKILSDATDEAIDERQAYFSRMPKNVFRGNWINPANE